MDGLGDRVRKGVTSSFGVPVENENGMMVKNFCAEDSLFGYYIFQS